MLVFFCIDPFILLLLGGYEKGEMKVPRKPRSAVEMASMMRCYSMLVLLAGGSLEGSQATLDSLVVTRSASKGIYITERENL